MPSTDNVSEGILIIPDPDDFIEIMTELQREYNKNLPKPDDADDDGESDFTH